MPSFPAVNSVRYVEVLAGNFVAMTSKDALGALSEESEVAGVPMQLCAGKIVTVTRRPADARILKAPNAEGQRYSSASVE